MTKGRLASSVALSLIIACVGIIAARRVVYSPAAQTKMVTRPVVVAIQHIDEGGAIDTANVRLAQWPTGTVPRGAYSSVDAVVGRVVSREMYKGEVVVPHLLTVDTTRRTPK